MGWTATRQQKINTKQSVHLSERGEVKHGPVSGEVCWKGQKTPRRGGGKIFHMAPQNNRNNNNLPSKSVVCSMEAGRLTAVWSGINKGVFKRQQEFCTLRRPLLDELPHLGQSRP